MGENKQPVIPNDQESLPSQDNRAKGHQHLNMDELFKQMALDDIESYPLITPVDYAKVHQGKVTPQLVYYYWRNKNPGLPEYRCSCGRRCLKKKEADTFFREIGKLPELRRDQEDE